MGAWEVVIYKEIVDSKAAASLKPIQMWVYKSSDMYHSRFLINLQVTPRKRIFPQQLLTVYTNFGSSLVRVIVF